MTYNPGGDIPAPQPPEFKPREIPNKGTHNAVCSIIYYVGKTFDETYSTYPKDIKIVEPIAFVFELAQKDDEGRPMVRSLKPNYTFGARGNMRQRLGDWLMDSDEEKAIWDNPERWGEINLGRHVGRPCLVTIDHKPYKTKPGTNAFITNVGPHMEGLEVLEPTLKEVPDWLKEDRLRGAQSMERYEVWLAEEKRRAEELDAAVAKDGADLLAGAQQVGAEEFPGPGEPGGPPAAGGDEGIGGDPLPF